MSARIGLYEFLACEVALTAGDTSAGGGTSLTATSTETYDDDPELGPMALFWSEATIDTRRQNETYEDDPGVEPLGDKTTLGAEPSAAIADYEHRKRAKRVCARDHVLETTVITRVVGETHDDDGASLQFDA